MSDGHAGTLAHHFDSYDQQRESASLGMWLFIAQEFMFFGGLFAAYLWYRMDNPEIFAIASSHLDIKLGGLNTAVLIASSLTMAMAVREAQLARAKRVVLFLLATFVLGGVFVGVKYVEYSEKFAHNTVPGPHFEFHDDSPAVAQLMAEKGFTHEHIESRAELFYSIYFAMTGLHALHMVIGMALIIWLLFPAWKGVFNADYHNPVECFGLYWHFVDIVWIFLFPMLYLLGAAAGH